MINGLYQPDSYAGDGAQKAFPITFEFVSTSDIRALVRVGDVDTVLTPGVGFTVSGTTLTTATAPASGATLIVYMEMPFTQKTDYRNTGKLSLEVLEKDLDKASLTSQELRDITLRCVKVPVGSTEDPDDYMGEIRGAVASTAADAAAAASDRAAVAADKATVAADKATVAADKATVAADKATAAADKATVAADKSTTSGYKDAAAASATLAGDYATSAGIYRDSAQTYAGNASSSASAAATDASDADTARIAAQAAQAAAEAAAANVGSYKHFTTATAGQTAIDTPWTFDPVAGNIFLIIGGVPQVPSSYTLTDSNTITLSEALLGGETIAVYSLTTPAAGSTPLYADQNLADVPNKTTALTNLGGAAKAANLSDLSSPSTAAANVGAVRGNLIINGDFRVNQRGYASGAATSAPNQYTLDRWRVVTSGQNLTFAASGSGNQVTAPAGGIEQPIEGRFIKGGTYTLSWVGTATATVGGVSVANGGQATLTANTDVVVKFSSGTVKEVKLEYGSFATPFEVGPDELRRCQRYYEKSFAEATAPAQNAGTADAFTLMTGRSGATASYCFIPFKVQKRAVPSSVTFFNPSAANAFARDLGNGNDATGTAATTKGANGVYATITLSATGIAGYPLAFHWTADAEM